MKQRVIAYCVLFLATYSGYGQSWSAVKNAPVVQYRFDDIYFVNDTTGWAVDGVGNIYKTNGQGKPWYAQFNTHRYMRSIEFINDTIGFAGSIDSAVYRTTNAGKNWIRIDKQFPTGVPGVCGMSHFGDSVLMVGTYFASPFVMRSPDAGNTWNYIDMSPYVSGLVDAWYKSADTVFVCGKAHDGAGIILRSVDGGAAWAEVAYINGPVPVGFMWKLHFPAASVGFASLEQVTPEDHLIGNETHFMKTIDGGATWKVMNANIGRNINLQGLGFINAQRGWIGGWSVGMYETTDGGDNWTKINDFANLNRFFFLREDFGYLSGTTIFQFRTNVVTGIQAPVAESINVHSMDVYPNPAHGETTVRVTLGVKTMTVLNLCDASGRVIKEISRGYREAGTYNYPVDMKGLAAGEYMAVLLTHEHFLATRIIGRGF